MKKGSGSYRSAFFEELCSLSTSLKLWRALVTYFSHLVHMSRPYNVQKGDKLLPVNYGPISLTASLCKYIEHVFVNRLLPFLMSNDNIINEQHGFILHILMTMNLMYSLDIWTKLYDPGTALHNIYLDLNFF